VTSSSHKLRAYRPPGWRDRAIEILVVLVALGAIAGLAWIVLATRGARP